jgi:hypothetical protein
MSIAAIASAAISFVAPYLVKGGEELAKGVGKDLWELIKKPFQKKDSHKEAIKELEAKPNDPIVQGKIIGKLEEHLEEDPEFAKELGAMVEKLSVHQQNNDTMTVTGDGNISVQGVQNSQININK